MTDPTRTKRLAHDLRDLANKALSLRAATEDFRHELVRGDHPPRVDELDLVLMQQRIHELWTQMDRFEGDLRHSTSDRTIRLTGFSD
jgi:hypothetical protein